MADPRPKILEWLHDTGYPFQLRIGRRFQAGGWSVNYSRWYRDWLTQKDRELDVKTIVGGVSKQHNSVFFSLCIECKSSKKPWIAFDSGSMVGKLGVLSVAAGHVTRMTLRAAHSEHLSLPEPFPASAPRVGGIVEAHGKRSNEEGSPVGPYAAVIQARSAAVALDYEYLKLSRESAPTVSTVGVFLPCVVFDGQLFRYSVGTDLRETLEDVDVVLASVAGDPENEATLVPVMTEKFADQIALTLRSDAHEFCLGMLPHASTIVAALQIEKQLD